MPPPVETREVPVGDLRPYQANPRNGDLDAIRESLEAHGQYRAIVARAQTGEILAGNHTYHAALELGYTHLLAHLVEVDDEQAARIVLVDNRTNDLAQYDDGLLAQLLQSLPDLTGTGYDERALDQLLAGLEKLSGADTDPGALPADPVTRPGDLIQLGDHRLLCGDATVQADVERLMSDATPALMATDPPYGISLDHTWRDATLNRTPARPGKVANDDTADWREAFALTPAPVAYVWHSALHSREAWDGLEAAGYEIRQQIIWVKSVHVLGRAAYQWKHEPCWYAVRKGQTASWHGDRSQMTVWEAGSPIQMMSGHHDDASTKHPTQKPLVLFDLPIRHHTRKHDVVYEPFAGSGTQLIAAENQGRHCYALEIDPAYCDVIIDRWERHTGQEATRP